MGLLSSLSNIGTKALNTLTVAIAHPIKTATAAVSPKTTINDVITEHFKQPLSKQITETVLGTASIAATIAGGAAISGAAKAGTLLSKTATIAKALIPATAKGKVVAAVVAPIVASAVIQKPSLITEVPSKVLNFQTNVGSLVANPSVSSAVSLVKENPVISSVLLGAGALALGKGVAGTVATISNTLAVKESTKATKEAVAALPTSAAPTEQVIKVTDKSQPLSTVAAVPVTPQTQTVSSGVSKPRKKRSYKAKINAMSQRVNVIVSNKNSVGNTKRYINNRILN
jgi:hypothetical protein